jgi:hypothetical protein
MSNTVEKTVATYVQLNDRQALEDLRTYRQGLAVHLKARTAIDLSLLTSQIDAEIAVIEAGLDRLNRAPSAEEKRQRRSGLGRPPNPIRAGRPRALAGFGPTISCRSCFEPDPLPSAGRGVLHFCSTRTRRRPSRG